MLPDDPALTDGSIQADRPLADLLPEMRKDVVATMLNLFPPNPARHGSMIGIDATTGKKKVVTRVGEPVTQQLLADHLGLHAVPTSRLGYLPGGEKDTTAGAIDLDGKEFETTLDDALQAVLSACRQACVHAYPERSTRGNGWHVWIFCERPLPYSDMQGALRTIVRRAGLSSAVETYPRSDNADGPWIITPYANALQGDPPHLGHTFLQDRDGRPIPVDELTDRIVLTPEQTMRDLAAESVATPVLPDSLAVHMQPDDLHPNAVRILLRAAHEHAPSARNDALAAFLNLGCRAGALDEMQQGLKDAGVYAKWCADGSRSHQQWCEEIDRWADQVTRDTAGPRRGLGWLRSAGFVIPTLPARSASDHDQPIRDTSLPVATKTGAQYTMPMFSPGTQEGTDEANAQILAHNGLSDRLRYTAGLGWYVYDPSVGIWRKDPERMHAAQEAGAVLRVVVGQHYADSLMRNLSREDRAHIARWAESVCNNSGVHNALKAATGNPSFHTAIAAWDADPGILNCVNGVLDLRSGTLRNHSSGDLLTWNTKTRYDPDAKHPYVDELLKLLAADGRHDYLQRSVGSTLYGENPNEEFTVLLGPGGTGKGTLVAAVVAMLGDYADTIEVDLLLAHTWGESATGPKPELLTLRKKRLVVAGEPPKGARFNAGRVKGMTGNDPITARNMRSPVMITFYPVFKLWVHSNYPIGSAHDDSGLQRRIRVVPFAAMPERANREFKKILQSDPVARSAMLNWALQGFRLWYGNGYDLGDSEVVTQATSSYWHGQNPYELFAAANLEFGSEVWIASARLKALFDAWTEEQGLGRTTKLADLHSYLRARQCTTDRIKSERRWRGVSELMTEVTGVTPHTQVRPTPPPSEEEMPVTPVTPVTSVTPDEPGTQAAVTPGWIGPDL